MKELIFYNKVLNMEILSSVKQIAKEKDFEMPIQISNDREI